MASHPDTLPTFAGRMWLQFRQTLPSADELLRRLNMKKQQLANQDCPFDDPCTACDGRSCWLLNYQGPWNELLNPGGPELRCYAPGRLFLTTLPLPPPELPAVAEADYVGNVLVVLWLLNNHRCIDRIHINTDVMFGDIAEVFYRLVQLGPHFKLIKMVRWLQTEEAKMNDEVLTLTLANTRNLESLTLSGPVLSQFAMANLCQVFFLNENIGHVSLTNVTMSAQCAQVILAALNECQNLKNVDIDFRIAIPGVPKALTDLLTRNTSIQKLSYLVDTAIRFPFKALSRNRTLKMLCVGRFLCDEEDIGSLGYMLRRNKHLQVLSVPVCTSERHTEQWFPFLEGLKESVGLVELDLHRSIISDEIAGPLAAALRVNTTLCKVNVGTNNLTGKAAKCFTEVLITNTVLKELWLGRLDGKMTEFADLYRLLEQPGVSERVYAQFCPALMAMLIRLLRENRRLPEINIAGTEPSPPELVNLLLFTIKADLTLTSLKLSLVTNLSSRSAQSLAILFKDSKVLKTVELSMTVMSLEIQLLSEGLQESTSILKLRVRSWCFDENSTSDFIKMLKKNRYIVHLILFKPRVETVDVVKKLLEALEDNYTLLTIDLFDDNFSRVMNFDILPLLCRNYCRVTRAAAFLQGTLADQEAADDFRNLALSTPLLERVREATESSEEDITAAITKKLEDMDI
ncbi:hypothetical protein ISCGN_000941 [Ixodes scapularis]